MTRIGKATDFEGVLWMVEMIVDRRGRTRLFICDEAWEAEQLLADLQAAGHCVHLWKM